MEDQTYNEVPDTSRSSTYPNETIAKFTMRLTIQVSDQYDIFVLIDEEDVSDLTIDHLKFRIRQMGVQFEKFKLTFGHQQLDDKKLLSSYHIAHGDRIYLDSEELGEQDLQVSSEPRANAVKAESLRLIEQLQNSIKEMSKQKQSAVIMNTDLCGTVESQGSFEEDSNDGTDGGDSEQGKQADTPRPSLVE